MQYNGWWDTRDERVLPFLKSALFATYSAGYFVGGRGAGAKAYAHRPGYWFPNSRVPDQCNESHAYFNELCDERRRFTRFCGSDMILRRGTDNPNDPEEMRNDTCVYAHNYMGGWLLGEPFLHDRRDRMWVR
jgi:hypothetical protein